MFGVDMLRTYYIYLDCIFEMEKDCLSTKWFFEVLVGITDMNCGSQAGAQALLVLGGEA